MDITLEKNKLLPLSETAKILDVHPATLRKLSKANKIKHVRIGKKYYFNLHDIKNDGYNQVTISNGVILSDGCIKVFIGDSHNSDDKGFACLHDLIIESHLGRKLKKQEKVIHKNNDLLDNNVDNLCVISDEIAEEV